MTFMIPRINISSVLLMLPVGLTGNIVNYSNYYSYLLLVLLQKILVVFCFKHSFK